MKNVHDDHTIIRVILIGGSSHVGKSTLSQSLAADLRWARISTDRLARHPGRPWKPIPQKVPDHVAEHYLSLSVDELLDDVLRHYRINVWSKVEAIVVPHASGAYTTGLVLEGSALWPDFVTRLLSDRVAALWLTADDELFRQRIHDESQYRSRSSGERVMIDKFLDRTLVYNSRMVEAVSRHGLNLVDVGCSNAAELAQRCLTILNREPQRLSTGVRRRLSED